MKTSNTHFRREMQVSKVLVMIKDTHVAHNFLAAAQTVLAVDGKLTELLTPHGLVADHLGINVNCR